MSQTNVPVGSPLARKVFGAALFARTQRQPSLMNNLTGPAPQQAAAEAKAQGADQPRHAPGPRHRSVEVPGRPG